MNNNKDLKQLKSLENLLEINNLPIELLDIISVFEMGAKKHGFNSWLDPYNNSLQHESNCDSMFHHLADHRAGINNDHQSGLHPLLHLATRAIMKYTRIKRGIDLDIS